MAFEADDQRRVPGDERLLDRPDADNTRPDLETTRKYPNGSPTYTSATAVPGERPWSGKLDPAVADTLGESALRQLGRLIDANTDNARDLEGAADVIDEQRLKGRLKEIAEQRRGFAEELRSLVPGRDQTGQGPGAAGTLRRWWHSVRAGTSNTRAVLENAEQGEDRLLHQYRAAQADQSLVPLQRVIGDQTGHVQRVHDEIRQLRDQWRAR